MSTMQVPMVEMDRKHVEALLLLLDKAGDIQVVPCDDMMEGVKGHIAFRTEGKGDDAVERSFWFCWRFARKPSVQVIRRAEYEEFLKRWNDLPDADRECLQGLRGPLPYLELIEDCMGPGWIVADSPLNLQLGFAKYAKPDSYSEFSQVYLFPLVEIKALDKALGHRIMEWRKSKMSATTRELIEALPIEEQGP
jgi:hypothetical protein